MAYYFIGSNKKSNVTWLDDLFDTSPTGGISAFLKEIAGSSSVFWTEEQQNFLKIIEDIQMLDIMQAANIFINMILNSDQKAISLVLDFLNILFPGLVKREHETEMYSILLILLQEEFIQKLQQLPYIYPVFIERLYSLLYVQEIPAELKTSILKAILPPHPEKKILDKHLPLILRLLYENTETEAVFSWIETTVKNPNLDFNMRRKIVRFLTERIMQFTPALQLEVSRIFNDLVKSNEWNNITELDKYRRRL